MRKNYILALLATGVVPMSAFAAIDVPGVATDKGSWDLSGVSNVTTTDDGKVITVPGAQGGIPACTIENLPAGEYVIKAGTLDANAKLYVFLDGEELTIKADGTFVTKKAGNLLIEVRPIDKSASYTFGNITLALNVDLGAIHDELAGLMPKGALTAPSDYMADYNNDDDNIVGTEVIAEYNKLKDPSALNDAIAALVVPGISDDATDEEKEAYYKKQMAAYNAYVENGLQKKVEDYAAEVKAYQDGISKTNDRGETVWTKYPIATINGWANTLHTNTVNHNADLAKIESRLADNKGWEKRLEELEATIASTNNTEDLTKEIAAAKKAIADAKAKIAENWAVKGVQVGQAAYQTVSMAEVEAAYDDLQKAYSALLDNEKRYTNLWLPKYQELTNAYINAQQEIKDLYKDEPEQGRKARQDSVLANVAKIYNDAVASLYVAFAEDGNGVCSEDDWTHDEPLIKQAIADLKARYEDENGDDGIDTKALKAEQKALKDGTDLVDGLTDSLDLAVINKDAYKKADLDAKKAALEAEIAALQKQIDDIYNSTTVLDDAYITGEFQTAVNAEQAKVTEFAKQVAVANQLGALTTALNKARTDISNSDDNQYLKALPKAFAVDVVDMMNGSYESIQAAIEQQQGIYDKDGYQAVQETSLENLAKSINVGYDSYLANGLKMAKDLADAYQIVIPAKTEADALVDFIKNENPKFDVKVKSQLEGRGVDLVNGVDQQKFIDKADEYQKKADATIKVLQDTRTMTSPQNAFDAIKSVMSDTAVTGLLANIKAEKVDFLKAVIGSENAENSNLEELTTALGDLTSQVDEIKTYAGFAAVDELYQKAVTDLDKVKADFNAVTGDSAAKKLVEINANAKALIPAFQAIQNEIDKVVKNHDAYDKVCDLVDQIVALQDPSKAYADEHTYEPARTSWKDLVDKKVKEATDLKADKIDATYEAVEMLKALTLDQTNAEYYTDKLNEILLDWFGIDGKKYKDAVDKNEVAHNVLLDESAEVTKVADEVNKFIEAAQVDITLEDGQNAANVFKGYLSELSDLDTDLYDAYKALTCDGQEKLTLTEPATLMDQYEALKAKINDLQAQLDSDYAKALKAYNEKFIKDNWNPFRLQLMDVYTQAVITLDEYRDIVNTCPSLAGDDEIQDGIDHQPVFKYADEIQALIDEVAQMLKNSWPSKVANAQGALVDNSAQRKLTDADLKPYLDQAADMEDAIAQIVEDKINQINEAAEGILEAKKNEVGKLITDTEKTLQDAGCDEDSIDNALKQATLAYDSAEKAIETPLEGTLQTEYISNIAKSLNLLDAVDITDAQMQAAAVSTFNNAVAGVDKKIAKAQKTLDESTLPDAKKNAFQKRITAAKTELNKYRNDEITLENLKEELAKVNGIDVDSIQTELDNAIADNEANNAAAADLNDKVADLQANLDALNEWVEQLLVAAEVPTTTLQAKITQVETAIEEAYKDELLIDASEVATLEGKIDAVQAEIDSVYAKAFKLEFNRLDKEEVLETNRAYNEAAKRYEEENEGHPTDYPDTEEGRAFTEKIAEQVLALGELSSVLVPTKEQRDAIVEIQNALLQIQIDLKYLTADDVLATLNEAAENAIATINASAAKLGNYAKPKYEGDYDDLIAEVEALQKLWTENEADRIVKEGVYLRDLNEIVTDKLSALDADAADYQADREANAAHEAASNAAYELLNADLTQVINAFNATTDNVQTYSVRLKDVVANMNLSEIADDIDEAQAKLEAAKAEFTCEEFEWDTPLEDISALIKNANEILWKTVTKSYQAEATQAIADAEGALNNGKDHVNADGYAAQISSLRNKLNKLAIVTDGSAVKGGNYVAAAEKIIADAEALFKSIAEAEFIPGDITGTGKVTSKDYEALIDLLGQIEDGEDFDNPAYDVNGDGSVTMADVASIIDILMGKTTNSAVMARMPMINTNNAIYVVKTSTNNGISRYALVLNNTAELFGAQMDIILGQGMEIVNEGVAERTSGNEFYGSTTYSGKHRIILSSIEMNTFVGSEGAIVYIDVRGEGELNLGNVLGVDTTGRMYNINVMTNVTGIESISADGKNADIFNVAGQKLNRAQRGAVNIIRTADGKTSKIINK